MSRSIVLEAMRRVPLLRLEATGAACPAPPGSSGPATARFVGCGDARLLLSARPRAGVLLAAAAALAIWSDAQRPLLQGEPQKWYRTSAPQVLLPIENAGNLGDLRRASIAASGREAARDRQGPRARARRCRGRRARGAHPGVRRAASSATASTRRSRSTSIPSARRSRSTACRPAGGRSASSGARRARLDAGPDLSRAARRRACALRRLRARSRSARRAHEGTSDGTRPRRQPLRHHAHRQGSTARRRACTSIACRVSLGTSHPTLRGSLDDASPVIVQARLDGISVALRGPDGKALLGSVRPGAASRCRCSILRREFTASRSRRSTPRATRALRRPGRSPSTRPRSCGRPAC